MIPNWGDSDGDGILDCWDGYRVGTYDQTALGNGARSDLFYPIVIEIPDEVDLAEVKFQLEYWMASTTPTNGQHRPPQYGDGSIRVWKKNGMDARNANGPNLGGDLIMSMTGNQYYTASQLGFSENLRTITLYVEAVKENSVLYHEEDDWDQVHENEKPTSSIIVRMEYDGQTVTDEVRYIVSHSNPEKSETASFWYNVLAKEEFRQAFASEAIYRRDNLPQFGMQLL